MRYWFMVIALFANSNISARNNEVLQLGIIEKVVLVNCVYICDKPLYKLQVNFRNKQIFETMI